MPLEEKKEIRTYANRKHLPDTVENICDDIKKTALESVQEVVDHCTRGETLQYGELLSRQTDDDLLQLVHESVTRSA